MYIKIKKNKKPPRKLSFFFFLWFLIFCSIAHIKENLLYCWGPGAFFKIKFLNYLVFFKLVLFSLFQWVQLSNPSPSHFFFFLIIFFPSNWDRESARYTNKFSIQIELVLKTERLVWHRFFVQIQQNCQRGKRYQ